MRSGVLRKSLGGVLAEHESRFPGVRHVSVLRTRVPNVRPTYHWRARHQIPPSAPAVLPTRAPGSANQLRAERQSPAALRERLLATRERTAFHVIQLEHR